VEKLNQGPLTAVLAVHSQKRLSKSSPTFEGLWVLELYWLAGFPLNKRYFGHCGILFVKYLKR